MFRVNCLNHRNSSRCWILLNSLQKRFQPTCTIKGRKEMFYLTTHSTHFSYGYMASDIWLRTILIVRKETRCNHIGYSFRLGNREQGNGIYVSISKYGSDTPVTRPETDKAGLSSRDRFFPISSKGSFICTIPQT